MDFCWCLGIARAPRAFDGEAGERVSSVVLLPGAASRLDCRRGGHTCEVDREPVSPRMNKCCRCGRHWEVGDAPESDMKADLRLV